MEQQLSSLQSQLLTVLRLARLNAWHWNLKTRDLTLTNTCDRETLGKISPLMAAETALVPNYPQVLVQKGIIRGNAVELVNEYDMLVYHAKGGQEVSFRIPFTNCEGSETWLQFRGVVYRDQDDQPDYAVGYYSDITASLESASRGDVEDLLTLEQEKQRYMNMIKGLTL